MGAALALGAADGLAAAAGRPPEDFLAATGPDDLMAFTTEEAACSDGVSRYIQRMAGLALQVRDVVLSRNVAAVGG